LVEIHVNNRLLRRVDIWEHNKHYKNIFSIKRYFETQK